MQPSEMGGMVRSKGLGKGTKWYRYLPLPLLLGLGTLFYYFGELVDFLGWEALRLPFFYGVHDVQRLLFLAPIIYAGYTGRIKGAIIVTLIVFVILLPRAVFLSPFPDPTLRMVLFVMIAGVIGSFVSVMRHT